MNIFLEEKLLPQMVACSQVSVTVILLLTMVSFIETIHAMSGLIGSVYFFDCDYNLEW